MNYAKTIFILLLLCSTSALAKVELKDKAIVYQGPINRENNANVAALLLQYPKTISTLEITSGGGNVDEGMDLAELVLAHSLDVVVPVFCFSSCANYVFVAGANKTLLPNSVIGWHGNAESARWRDEDIDAMVENLAGEAKTQKWLTLREHYDNVILLASERETALYKTLNVNPEIMTLGLRGQIKDAALKSKARGWTYSLSAMKTLGVQGLESSQGWQPIFNQRFPLVIVSSLE